MRGLPPNTPAYLRAHVQRIVRTRRERGDADRRVRVRRPFGWSRDDFATFLALHAQRSEWSYTLVSAGDCAVLEVTDQLLDADDADDAEGGEPA